MTGRKATVPLLMSEHQLFLHGRTPPNAWSDFSSRKSSSIAAPKASTLNMVCMDMSSIPEQHECGETGDSSGQSRYEKEMRWKGGKNLKLLSYISRGKQSLRWHVPGNRHPFGWSVMSVTVIFICVLRLNYGLNKGILGWTRFQGWAWLPDDIIWQVERE